MCFGRRVVILPLRRESKEKALFNGNASLISFNYGRHKKNCYQTACSRRFFVLDASFVPLPKTKECFLPKRCRCITSLGPNEDQSCLHFSLRIRNGSMEPSILFTRVRSGASSLLFVLRDASETVVLVTMTSRNLQAHYVVMTSLLHPGWHDFLFFKPRGQRQVLLCIIADIIIFENEKCSHKTLLQLDACLDQLAIYIFCF